MTEHSEVPAKKIGRPRKRPEQGRRLNVMFRLSEATQVRAKAAAMEAGRSLSEELERRVEQSFDAQTTAELTVKLIREMMEARNEY